MKASSQELGEGDGAGLGLPELSCFSPNLEVGSLVFCGPGCWK